MRLLALCLGYFMVILDATIVNVALPDVHADLGGSVAALQWVVNGYTLALAGLLLTGGALADRIGARRVLVAGLVAFGAASAACSVAPSAALLVVARVVQGAAAAATVPASLALIRATYSDAAERTRAVGLWGAVAGVAAATGPVAGGLLVSAAGWRAVFAVNVPIAAAATWLVVGQLPRAPRHLRGIDAAGQLLGAVALTAATAAAIESGPASPGLVALAATAAIGFVAVERRARAPVVPPSLFRRPAFGAASAVGLLINLGFYGQLFVFNLYLQEVRGMSPLAAGLALLPMGGVVSIASAVSGRVAARRGVYPVMLVGLSIGACGLAALATAGAHTPYLLLVPPLLATGAGMALTMPAATTAAVDAAPAASAGVAAGVLNAARQVGGALGVALLGALFAHPAGGSLTGLHVGLALAACSFAAGALVTWRGVRVPACVS